MKDVQILEDHLSRLQVISGRWEVSVEQLLAIILDVGLDQIEGDIGRILQEDTPIIPTLVSKVYYSDN